MRQVQHLGPHQVLADALVSSQKDLAMVLEPIIDLEQRQRTGRIPLSKLECLQCALAYLFDVLLKAKNFVAILKLLFLVDPQELELPMIREDLLKRGAGGIS